jgi:FMN phosphatase YigB (HAD superfamily)
MKTILVDAWNTFVTNNGINHEMNSLLDSYPNDKLILTNANPAELIKFGIVNMPYEVYSLHHEPNKTDSNYFTKMLNHFCLSTNNVLYFEHNEDAVKAAKNIGIVSLHFNKGCSLSELQDFLNQNI